MLWHALKTLPEKIPTLRSCWVVQANLLLQHLCKHLHTNTQYSKLPKHTLRFQASTTS